MSKIILSLETIEKLKMFAGQDDCRYYLKGLYFDYRKDKKDFVIVATNGHFCVVFKSAKKWDGEAFDSFILPTEDVLPMAAYIQEEFIEADEGGYCKPYTQVHVAIDTEKKRIAFLEDCSKPVGQIDADEILEKGLSKIFTPTDATYPDYTKIFPAPEALTGCPCVGFSAEYLSKISSIGEPHHTTFLINSDRHMPTVAFIKTLSEDEYCFVLMPIRDTPIEKYPDWFIRTEK
jgi:hypothetical protein